MLNLHSSNGPRCDYALEHIWSALQSAYISILLVRDAHYRYPDVRKLLFYLDCVICMCDIAREKGNNAFVVLSLSKAMLFSYFLKLSMQTDFPFHCHRKFTSSLFINSININISSRCATKSMATSVIR